MILRFSATTNCQQGVKVKKIFLRRPNIAWFSKMISLIFLICYIPRSLADVPDFPVYVQQIPNHRDYTLFANGGWDDNWYVGYDTCWITRLPMIPTGTYERAYIGAKLGRMKSHSSNQKHSQRVTIPGKIYIAISSTKRWSAMQKYRLVDTSELPLEGDPNSAMDKVEAAQWFWVEVPVSSINFEGDNYIALWSPSPELRSKFSSPILAAARGGSKFRSWVLRNVKGMPPIRFDANRTAPIPIFQPAIAVKLIPSSELHPMKIAIVSCKNSQPNGYSSVVTARAEGDSIVRSWLEYSIGDSPDWRRLGHYLWDAPYIFDIDGSLLPHGNVRGRIVTANIWEEQNASEPFNIVIGSVTTCSDFATSHPGTSSGNQGAPSEISRSGI